MKECEQNKLEFLILLIQVANKTKLVGKIDPNLLLEIAVLSSKSIYHPAPIIKGSKK